MARSARIGIGFLTTGYDEMQNGEPAMDKDDVDHFKTIAAAQAKLESGLSKQQSAGSSALVRDPAYILQKATTICACYRKDEVQDPEMYISAVAAVLACYPKVTIDYVADPRTGIASTSKWLPSVSEIREACEEHLGRITRDLERSNRINKQLAEREADENRRKENRRMTYDELKAKHGDGKGGWLDQKPKVSKETIDNLKPGDIIDWPTYQAAVSAGKLKRPVISQSEYEAKPPAKAYTEEEKAAFLKSARQAGKDISGMQLSEDARRLLREQNQRE